MISTPLVVFIPAGGGGEVSDGQLVFGYVVVSANGCRGAYLPSVASVNGVHNFVLGIVYLAASPSAWSGMSMIIVRSMSKNSMSVGSLCVFQSRAPIVLPSCTQHAIICIN